MPLIYIISNNMYSIFDHWNCFQGSQYCYMLYCIIYIILLDTYIAAVRCGNLSIPHSNIAGASGVYRDQWTVVCKPGYLTPANTTAYNTTCAYTEDIGGATHTQEVSGGGWWTGLHDCIRGSL